jgi:hypothetical protein
MEWLLIGVIALQAGFNAIERISLLNRIKPAEDRRPIKVIKPKCSRMVEERRNGVE